MSNSLFYEGFVLPILRIPPELTGNGFSRPEMDYNPPIEASSYWCGDSEVRDCISGVSWTTRCPGGEAARGVTSRLARPGRRAVRSASCRSTTRTTRCPGHPDLPERSC